VVDLIKMVYVINEAGETLAAIPLGNFHADEALFGGFLSAIDMFSQKMAGDSINELILGNDRVLVAREGTYLLVTVHDKGDNDSQSVSRKVSETFRRNFAGLVTDELTKAIREAALGSDSVRGRAEDWASKML
jgi:virulence-associated protein VagC